MQYGTNFFQFPSSKAVNGNLKKQTVLCHLLPGVPTRVILYYKGVARPTDLAGVVRLPHTPGKATVAGGNLL